MSSLTIHSSLLFDPKKKAFVENVSITVDPKSGSIIDVYERSEELDTVSDQDIDLRGKVVMPGFVDAHTHIFLHSYEERTNREQNLEESIVERVVRATHHARRALLAGYTTYRDLGSEGMASFDANLRDCVNRGMIPGPRMFVATHPLASTGGYQFLTENAANGVRGPQMSDACNGTDDVRAAVRRRVADGADVIKFYADYLRTAMRFPGAAVPPHDGSILFPPSGLYPHVVMYSQEEMDTIVQEAKLAGLPVACHAGSLEGAKMAVRAGITSLEHGAQSSDELFIEMRRHKCIFVPTLTVMHRVVGDGLKDIMKQTKKAYDLGVRLATGGDIGPVSHGENARELELMVEAGIPIEAVLEACTVGGWEACGAKGSGFKFGWFEKGCRADIIALEADPRTDKHALRKVDFVMKDGRVWKRDGVPIGMIDELMGEATPRSQAHKEGWEML